MTLVRRTNEYTVLREGPVVALVCHERAPAEAFESLVSAFAHAPAGPLGLLVVSRPAAQLFSDESSRQRFGQILHALDERLACVASVVRGTGFAAAIAHSAVTSLSMRERLACRMELFGDLEQALSWMAVDLPNADVDGLYERIENSRPAAPTPAPFAQLR